MTAEERRALIRRIALRAEALGGRAMLVGGCVRDGLLGRESEDIDCEVYGLTQESLGALAASFGQVDRSGEKYGIFALRSAGIDLAMPRSETRTGAAHGDFDVVPDGSLPMDRAAARRDFTVNAILQDALTGEIFDPFGGREDLERGILRAVPGGQFEEDPLRVLRGAQFAARFGLTPDAQTMAAFSRMPLDALTPARVLGEMKKALLLSPKPDVFFDVLQRAGALSPFLCEVEALCGVPQNPAYHPEGDAYRHTMLVVREAAQERKKAEDPLAFMLAALTHDLGKAVTTKKNEKGNWASIGHEIAGIPLAERMLTRLGVPLRTVRYAKNMCRLHMRVHTCYYQKARVSRTNLLFDEAVSARELGLLCVCDARGTGKPREQAGEEQRFIEERLLAYEEAGPLPTGQMVLSAGGRPGPAMAEALKAARKQVLCGTPLAAAVHTAAEKTRRAAE